jgi:hypothetical protein
MARKLYEGGHLIDQSMEGRQRILLKCVVISVEEGLKLLCIGLNYLDL